MAMHTILAWGLRPVLTFTLESGFAAWAADSFLTDLLLFPSQGGWEIGGRVAALMVDPSALRDGWRFIMLAIRIPDAFQMQRLWQEKS